MSNRDLARDILISRLEIMVESGKRDDQALRLAVKALGKAWDPSFSMFDQFTARILLDQLREERGNN